MKSSKHHLIPIILLLHTTTAFPIPRHLHPRLPTLPRRPNLHIRETATHILATITHPSLNGTTTARVTLATTPLTVIIDPMTGRPLTRRIVLQKTFTNVSIRAREGAVQLVLQKTVADLPKAVRSCHGPTHRQCLQNLAAKVCLPVHLRVALKSLSCSDTCVESVLVDCQKPDFIAESAAILTQIVFGVVAGVMVISYGWGFASAIVSIPKELARLIIWGREVLQRIRVEGVKLGMMDALMKLVL